MLRFFRFIYGFLQIKFSGENAEKIINLCAQNGIKIWNMRCKKGYITANISISDFKALRRVKRGVKVRIKITAKRGLPFIIKLYKNRSGLIIGAVLFLCLIKLMSGFVWCISVEGNKTVKTSEILSACSDLGIKSGVRIKDIDKKDLAQKLILKVNNLAWAAINTEGCYLTVDLTEASNTDKNGGFATNIKAKEDGIIEKINVTSGNTLVKIGDVVAKGDLLVSGIAESSFQTQFIKSRGEIIAKTVHIYKKEYPLTQSIKTPFGKEKSKMMLEIFGLKFPLFLENNKPYAVTKARKNDLTVLKQKLPITVYDLEYRNTKKVKVKFTEDVLTQKCLLNIEKEVKKGKFSDYILTNSETKTEGGILSVKATYECRENISEEEVIILSGIN